MLIKFFKKINSLRVNTGLDIENYFNLIISKVSNKKSIKTHYARVNNFGDQFNNDLLHFYGYNLNYTKDYKESKVSLTGSILGAYLRDYNGYVLGSGFLRENYDRKKNNWKVELIRGPLSATQCGIEENILFGDPGILASKVFNTELKNKNKSYKLGIIPHSKDLNMVRSLTWPENVLIINPRQKAKKVAQKMYDCEYIASSSLHGLIFADSFMIPNIHIKFGDRLIGNLHKFNDYYMGMDTQGDCLIYKEGMNVEEIVDKCKIRFSKEYLMSKISLVDSKISQILKKVSY